MKLLQNYILLLLFIGIPFCKSQEALPIYSDYLTDNYYLIHPSMAGASNCGKIRLTTRQQWFGQDEAPSLGTLSVNTRLGDTPSGLGAIVYTDKNGYHSQTGGYLTYAYHLLLSRNEVDLNMLSFGLSAGAIQYKLDETSFYQDGYDPIIAGIEQTTTNFNIDFGFSYHLYDFYAHVTVKNILKNEGINSNENGIFRYDNPTQYLFSTGYVFARYGSDWSFEPSFMFQYRSGTKESNFDLNFKAYKKMRFGKLWGGISYRRSLDGAEFQDGSGVSSQKLQIFSPLIGVNLNKFMFAYTYGYQANSVVFSNGGFHQLTLGFDFGCRREKFDCNCPAVN